MKLEGSSMKGGMEAPKGGRALSDLEREEKKKPKRGGK